MKTKNYAPTAPKRMKLRLDQLKTEPETFQFRQYETREDHVRELEEVVAGGGTLDSITVWKRGDGDFVILDGHHRHAAYTRCRFTKAIPVVVHRVSEAEAVLLALKENCKTKLPMTKNERQNAAWRLVCSEHNLSKAQTVKATGVSDGTVAKMRRTRNALLKADQPPPDRWWLAMRLLKGIEPDEWDDDMREQAIKARAAQLDAAIGPNLGRMAQIQWEAVAAVLERRIPGPELGYIIDALDPRGDDLDDEEDYGF